jgi:PAS domain-containing protein
MSGSERTSGGTDGILGSPPGPRIELNFQAVLESICESYLVVGPDLVIIYASDAYLRETRSAADRITGRTIAEAFGSDSGHKGPTSAADLEASLDRARRSKTPDVMPIQSFPGPVPPPLAGGIEARYRSPVSVPVMARGGELAYLVHRLEDVTEYVRINQVLVAELERRTRPAADAAGVITASGCPRCHE